MAYTPHGWRKIYCQVIIQKDSLRQLSSCEKIRRLMQERLIELSSNAEIGSSEVEKERREIEDALRRVWKIEQNAHKS